jgi:hypothetical protein
MADLACNSICIIHFDGKEGEIKQLTTTSIAKIVDLRNGWIEVSTNNSSFSEVAHKSFEYIDSSGEINHPHKIEFCGFHLACYRKFTDITKLEKARNALANASRKRPAEIETNESEGQSRPKRSARQQSLGEKTSQSSRSKHVLPEVCLICKRTGPIYITDPVLCF